MSDTGTERLPQPGDRVWFKQPADVEHVVVPPGTQRHEFGHWIVNVQERGRPGASYRRLDDIVKTEPAS